MSQDKPHLAPEDITDRPLAPIVPVYVIASCNTDGWFVGHMSFISRENALACFDAVVVSSGDPFAWHFTNGFIITS